MEADWNQLAIVVVQSWWSVFLGHSALLVVKYTNEVKSRQKQIAFVIDATNLGTFINLSWCTLKRDTAIALFIFLEAKRDIWLEYVAIQTVVAQSVTVEWYVSRTNT